MRLKTLMIVALNSSTACGERWIPFIGALCASPEPLTFQRLGRSTPYV